MYKHKGFFFTVVLCFILLGMVFVLTGCASEKEAPLPETKQEGQEEAEGIESAVEEKEESDTVEEEVPEMPEVEMKITYWGHATFLVEVGETRVLMDPYSPATGYGTLSLEADVVTASHEHNDHNYVSAAQGNPTILHGLAEGAGQWQKVNFSNEDLRITSLGTYHDGAQGRDRGLNTVFILDTAGLRLVHLGDLGHILAEEQLKKLTPLEILLIPVGGHYTIGPAEADQVIEQLNPRVVIPMHYRTQVIANWPLQELNAFLEGKAKINYSGEKTVTVTPKTLPETREIWPLSP